MSVLFLHGVLWALCYCLSASPSSWLLSQCQYYDTCRTPEVKVWGIEVWLRSELLSWQLSQCHDDMRHVVASWETVCSQHYSLCYPTRRQVTPGCRALFFWPLMRTLPPQCSLLCPQALAFILLLTHFFFTWGGIVWLLKCYTLQLHWCCILWSIGVGDSGDTGKAVYCYWWWRLVTLVKQCTVIGDGDWWHWWSSVLLLAMETGDTGEAVYCYWWWRLVTLVKQCTVIGDRDWWHWWSSVLLLVMETGDAGEAVYGHLWWETGDTGKASPSTAMGVQNSNCLAFVNGEEYYWWHW